MLSRKKLSRNALAIVIFAVLISVVAISNVLKSDVVSRLLQLGPLTAEMQVEISSALKT